MIIDEQFRECVVYLYADIPSNERPGLVERKPVGTAFLVSIRIEGETRASIGYIVTAGHVIQRSSKYQTLFVRYNMQDGTMRDVPTNSNKDWFHHPNPNADVAIWRHTNVPNGANQIAIPTDLFIDASGERMPRVTAGDEVFSVCLFSPYPGRTRNEPICVFGNICLMPQLIPTKLLGPQSLPVDVEAYLTEWKSWGGMSGSPVFIYFAPDRDPGSITLGVQPIFLLGLVHGHMRMPQEIEFTGDVLGTGKVDINTGIAVVIPAERIQEILHSAEIVAEREQELQNYRQSRPTATPDGQEHTNQ